MKLKDTCSALSPASLKALIFTSIQVVEYPPASSALCSTMTDASAASRLASAAPDGGS
jgi:hypothetical protein